MRNKYNYTLQLNWLGNENSGHHREDRFYEINIDGKDLLLYALSACHMMSYLYVCRKEGIKIASYQDNAEGVLKIKEQGIGRFKSVVLKPQVVLVDSSQSDKASKLHAEAGKLCFIANSVNFEISYDIETV